MNNNDLRLQSPWPEVREKLKEIETSLTDTDLIYLRGREDELLKHLSDKLQRDKQSIKSWIESVSANGGKAG
jgi:hypothetical protein